MPDLTATVALGDLTDFKYDDASGLLYVEAGATLYQWAPQTGTYSGSVSIANATGNFDLTADGLYALVVEGGNVVDRVSLSDLSVTRLAYPATAGYLGSPNLIDIAATSSGVALGATRYYGVSPYTGPLGFFQAEAPTLSLGSQTSSFGVAGTVLQTSEDRRYALIVETATSGGGLAVYDSQSDAIIAAGGIFGAFNTGKASISSAAGLVADLTGNNIEVFDLHLGLQKDLSFLQSAGSVIGVQFSADGHQLFLWDSRSDTIRVFDTQSWAEEGSVAVSVDTSYQANGSLIGIMAGSADGRFLFLGTSTEPATGNPTGFEMLDLAARLHLTATGDAAHTRLYGSVGSDTLTGSAANDTIDGGGGDDLLNGGDGVNTVSYASASAGVTVSLALQGAAQDTVGSGHDALSNFQNLTGSAFADILSGDANNNIIDGGAGDDTLTGGGGADTFVIRPDGGSDTITDLSVAEGDAVDLRPSYKFGSLSQLLAVAAPSGSDTVIDLGGGQTLTLEGLLPGDLTAAEFLLTTAPIEVGDTTITTDPALVLSATSGALVQFTDPNGGLLVNKGALSLTNPTAEGASAGVTTAALPETAAVFENDGTFSTDTELGQGVSGATVHNYGTFTVSGGVNGGQGATGDFVNWGVVQVSGAGKVIGDNDQTYLFQNEAGATFETTTSSGDAIGVALAKGGAFTNDGAITVSATGDAKGLSVVSTAVATTIVNTGSITATGATSTGIAVAASTPVSLQNSGTITAETAISYTAPYAAAVTNSGTLHGDLVLGNATNQVTNTGTIDGDITLGNGANDVLDSHLGTITGTVRLGTGSSTVTLGAGDDDIALAGGTHVVNGGGGTNSVSYINAGHGVTVSLAAAGVAQSTGVGTDTLINIQKVTGTAFNDTLTEAASGTSWLFGFSGADTYKIISNSATAVITFFQHSDGDKIDLSALGITSDTNLHAFQDVTDAVIPLAGGGAIRLQGTEASTLQSTDFIFAPGSGGTGGTGGTGSTAGTGGTSAGLKINVTYDASVAYAPALFKTAVQAAVQFFQSTFTDNVTVNITIGWGEVHGRALQAGMIGATLPSYDNAFTYQDIYGALNGADAGSATVSGAAASLPASDPTGGAYFSMTTAEEKALGLYAGSSFTSDGYIGLSSSSAWTFNPNSRAVAGAYDGLGVLEHEIAHLLGRTALASTPIDLGALYGTVTVDTPLDLFRFTAPGVHTFQPGAAYFSLDNGATNLKAFNDEANGADGDDWASGAQPDSFDARGTLGARADVSDVDVHLLELLGYSVSPTAAVFGNPTVGPGIGGSPQTAAATGGTLTGGAGDDWLQGQAGNDVLHGGMGSDYLDGGVGVNTAAYDGVYRQYAVGPGGATVSGGPESGTDDLVNIQRIQFVDGYLATSPTDTAGQVYRLYEATLGRAPDQQGLANWVHALNGGTSLQTAVDGFVGSQEFQAKYGALDDAAFVTLLYHNVLHRDPDASGLGNWVSALNSGTSRAQVVTGFSESQEDIADLAGPVQQGLWIQDAAAAEAARLYDTVFGRLPDAGGLAAWTHVLESGTRLQTVAGDFVASQEFQTTYGNLDATAFVTLLYHNVLHRGPDASGLNGWVAVLNSGRSQAEVVIGFSESQEHMANTAAHIDYGIWLAS